MKNNLKEGQDKGMDTNEKDDALGENSEQTPLANEVEKEQQAEKDQNEKKQKSK